MSSSPQKSEQAQRETVAFLKDPATHGVSADLIDHIETHISQIFIAGPTTYKLKRALSLNFLDFSTVADRRRFCEREVALNRAFAPKIYRRAVPVLRENGVLKLGNAGDAESPFVVDWLVEMATFDRTQELDRLADAGALTERHIDLLADIVSGLHDDAPVIEGAGGPEAVLATARGVRKSVGAADCGEDLLTTFDRWLAAFEEAIAPHLSLLETRRRDGCVRRCHGDLHLGNIVLLDGVPTPFDAIEFSEEIGSIDVLYDLAFPVMDLLVRGERRYANRLVSRYLNQSRAYDGLPLLAPFTSLRAAVRAMVTALSNRSDAIETAEALVQTATTLLAPTATPQLFAVGGLSGSGKSTLASSLAPAATGLVGAVVFRADVYRKSLFGVHADDRLPETAYSPDARRSVLDQLMSDATATLRAGWSAVIDTTFADRATRARVEALAREAGAVFCGVWLETALHQLKERVAERRHDPSDATPAVVDQQWERRDQAPEKREDWLHIDASQPSQKVAETALHALTARGADLLSPPNSSSGTRHDGTESR